ncbi:hypothetical protein HY449_02710 [Candidatus Pacearchaeota archaeon]|nr:hypothetical protein [Candidatus Pacearchaeota archaeon]
MKVKNKLGQEEMVGFALIIIIVAIVILVFLGFSLRGGNKETVESYEVESFIQSFLQYTSECGNEIENLQIRDLIFSCDKNENCAGGRNSCDVLDSELSGIIHQSWPVGEERPVKGYELAIFNDRNETILNLAGGNATENSKGGVQEFFRGGTLIDITFKAYY